MQIKTKLTNREMDILNILWSAQSPLTASEIAKSKETLTVNTVQANLRKLQNKNLIRVADIVYSGTVLSRSYETTITKNEFAVEALDNYFKDNNISILNTISTLLKNDKLDEASIDGLQEMLNQWKEQFKRK